MRVRLEDFFRERHETSQRKVIEKVLNHVAVDRHAEDTFRQHDRHTPVWLQQVGASFDVDPTGGGDNPESYEFLWIITETAPGKSSNDLGYPKKHIQTRPQRPDHPTDRTAGTRSGISLETVALFIHFRLMVTRSLPERERRFSAPVVMRVALEQRLIA